jgi:diguanylate cyclase (GGDEF)-like protein
MGGFTKAFKLRSIAVTMSILFCIMAAVYFIAYVSTKNTTEKQLSLNAKALAVSIACIVMEDIDGYKNFVQTKDIYSEYYRRMQSIFLTIKVNSNVKYIYSERKIDENTFEYILDAEMIEHHEYSPPGSIEGTDPRRETVYATERPAAFHLFKQSRWGVIMSGFAPIFDHDGTMLGLVGVDIDNSQIYTSLNRLQIVLLALYIGFTIIILLLLLRFADTFLEPLFKDKLTGAYSKRYSEKLIQKEITAAVKSGKKLSLMMLDLDHFKNINDTYGHGFGDKVLSVVSETIKKSLREQDYFIRYGGEEFIALLPRVAENPAKDIAERIRQSVNKNEILNEEKNIPVKMTISIGIATLADAAVSVQELIERADRALYTAKIRRNSVCTFEG